MVCKEDVVLWFKDLESYKRIDVVYELLKMCLPFELRFVGTCVEDLGKDSYQELRGREHIANDLDKMSKDTTLGHGGGLFDEKVRHRVLIHLSLLSSRNYSVANWLYKNVLRTEGLDNIRVLKDNINDDLVQSDFFLLFVMALHHPAFSFEHKQYFLKILSQLTELSGSRSYCAPPNPTYTYAPIYAFAQSSKPMLPPEVPLVPGKTSIPVPCAEDILHQHIPGITQPLIFPEFGMTRTGPPEVPRPFPTGSPQMPEKQPVSSPVQSRTNSPHRTIPNPHHHQQHQHHPPSIRNILQMQSSPQQQQQQPPPSLPHSNLPPQPPPQHQQPSIDISTQLPLDLLSASNNYNTEISFSNFSSLKLAIENEAGFPLHPPKQQNGYRVPPMKNHRYLEEQFAKMNMGEPEKSLQRSNSSSSSSLNHTPPETPSSTPLNAAPCPTSSQQQQQQQCKARVNGMPPYGGGLPPMCDTTSPPPPPPQFNTFNNCSVPYSVSYATLPHRSLYQYRPQYPPFYQTNDNSITNFIPVAPNTFIFSQLPHARPVQHCCFNCGGSDHLGQDCTGQTIEDIIQKQTFSLDYSSPPLPDADK